MHDEDFDTKGDPAVSVERDKESASEQATIVSDSGIVDGERTVVASLGADAGLEATVVASPDADRTVITAALSGDATVVTGAGGLVAAPVEQFKPVVEMAVSAQFPYALARQKTTNHVLVEASSFFEGRETARAPVAVALVLDKSGSMEGRPMEQLKIAVKYLVDRLTPADLLTIVVFGEESEVVMPLRRVLNANLIKQHVDAIRPRGTTNLWGGISDAVVQLLSTQAPHHLKRVLLLTDGEANEGITDYQSIVSEVRSRHASGISFSTLGMGIEYNEELMMAIAKNTGGNYHFVEHPDEIPKVFERELGSLFGVVGNEPEIRLKLRKGVSVARVYGLEYKAEGREVTIGLPSLEAGTTQAALIELAIEPHPPARFKKLEVELSYKPFGGTERVTQRAGVVFEFTLDKDKVRGHESERVRQALATRDVAAQLERAASLAGKDAQTATMIVSQAETQLLASGRSEDATIIAGVAAKMKTGQVDAATKLLSGARFRLDQDKTQIQKAPNR
ncbi:MAG: VWA domain-containing protein [bacterium]|jgi:Ca-activated chloride channel family protein